MLVMVFVMIKDSFFSLQHASYMLVVYTVGSSWGERERGVPKDPHLTNRGGEFGRVIDDDTVDS